MLHFDAVGSGPGLAFIHAGVADSRMWEAEVAKFSPRFRAVSMDLRGFGRSPHVPGAFACHDDIAEVLRAAGLARATLVGCSFGSTVAIETALAYPDLVAGLVLVSPSLGAGESEAMARFDEEESALLDRGDLEGATELNLRMWVDGPHRTPEVVAADVRGAVRAMQLRAFQLEVPEGVRRTKLEPPADQRLGEIRVPALVAVGALDQPFILETAERLLREIRGARRLVLPDAAHLPSLERPTLFHAALSEFLAR